MMEKKAQQTIFSGMKKIEKINNFIKSSRRSSPKKLIQTGEDHDSFVPDFKFEQYRETLEESDRKKNQLLSQKDRKKEVNKKAIINDLKEKNSSLIFQLKKKNLEIHQLKADKEFLQSSIERLRSALSQISEAIQPYQNNVTLMESELFHIKAIIEKVHHDAQSKDKIFQNEHDRKNNLKIELNTLEKTHRYEQEKYQDKFHRLNVSLTQSLKKNIELEEKLLQNDQKIQILNGIINEGEYASKQRELFHMANEELLSYQYFYERQKSTVAQHKSTIQKLRNKITMLTSLIGYGVVSPVQNNDLYDVQIFKQNLIKRDETNRKISNDVYGLSALASNKKFKTFILMAKNKQRQNFNTLYLPNFLVFYDHQLFIDKQSQEDTTTIIKPEFFLTLRAILDSKYRQFTFQGTKTSKFCQFVYSFIHKFCLQKEYKNIILNNKNMTEDKDLVKTSFLLRIFDPKITNLPEIKTFREFLMSNYSQDEVFYYLMCRNLMMEGPQLRKYISCSDSYVFLQYNHVHRCLTNILGMYNKATKEIILSNINNKKITKNKKLLIKAGYVLRILLQVYRKDKREKIQKLNLLFNNVNEISKTEIMKFIYFWDILSKNFPNLSITQISSYYRQTISVYQTQNKITFFQAFYASCSEDLLLSHLLKQDIALKKEIFKHLSSEESCNYLMEVIPDSVSQIGSESLYQEYTELIKAKSLTWLQREKIANFLIKIVGSKILKRCEMEEINKYERMLDKFNNSMIDWININVKGQRDYEEKIQKSSKKIGRKLKIKVYEFYQEFINDIKKELEKTKQQSM